MKYCPFCGNAMDDEMLFCSKCGKRFPEIKDISDDNHTPKRAEKNETDSDTLDDKPEIDSQQETPTAINPATEETPKKKHTVRNVIIILLLVIVGAVGWVYYKAWNANNNYNNAIDYYNQGQYQKAYDCFVKAGDTFPNVFLYETLCQGHINNELSKGQVSVLCRNLGFMDTKSFLLSTYEIARVYLEGYWATDDDYYYIEFYKSGSGISSQYNLPHEQPENATSYSIKDGIYYYDVGLQKIEGFRFTILSENKMMVYCYSDNSRYELYRKE